MAENKFSGLFPVERILSVVVDNGCCRLVLSTSLSTKSAQKKHLVFGKMRRTNDCNRRRAPAWRLGWGEWGLGQVTCGNLSRDK